MKKTYFLFSAFYLLVLLLPLAASAQVSLPYFGGNPPFVSCSGTSCTTCDIFETGQRVIYFGMTMILFVLAPIMIVIGGMMMLIAGGSEERFSSGRRMATGAVIGILIALCAFLIVNFAVTTLVDGRIDGLTLSGLTISCTATSPYVPPTNINQQNQSPLPQDVPTPAIPTGGSNDIAPI